METAKVIKNGDEQFVQLPKDFNLNDDEILIRQIGKMVLLVPKGDAWEVFMDGLNGFSDDFFPNGRETQAQLEQEKN